MSERQYTLLGMIGKTVEGVYKFELSAYEREYLVRFTDGTTMKITSVDHHSCYGFDVEWIDEEKW